MKKLAIIVLIGLCAQGAHAQQDAQFSQYMFNGLVLNPAFAGSADRFSAAFFYRDQWIGWEGKPVTQSVSIHSPALHKSVGLGLHVLNESIGIEKKTSIVSSYSYRINLKGGIFSMGLQGGFQSYSIDQSGLDVRDTDDERFYPTVNSRLIPDFGFGSYFIKKKYYVGFSVPHLLQTKINLSDYDEVPQLAKLSRHYFLTGAYVFQMSRDLDIIPSGIIKTVANAPLSFDGTVHFRYQNKIWSGVTYRVGDSFNVQAGVNIPQLINNRSEQSIKIGYAFDVTASKFRKYNSGSHEIMLIYDFDLKPSTSKIDKNIHYTSPRLF